MFGVVSDILKDNVIVKTDLNIGQQGHEKITKHRDRNSEIDY